MTDSSISSLDEARAANPDLGFALYAYDPDAPVTLEVHTPDGQVFTWTGPSEANVLSQAFPPAPEVSEMPTVNIFE